MFEMTEQTEITELLEESLSLLPFDPFLLRLCFLIAPKASIGVGMASLRPAAHLSRRLTRRKKVRQTLTVDRNV